MALLESGMLLFWPFIVVILIVGLLIFFTVQTARSPRLSATTSLESCGRSARAQEISSLKIVVAPAALSPASLHSDLDLGC
jgi:hypothetical protein